MTMRDVSSVSVCTILTIVMLFQNAGRAESDDVWNVGQGRATHGAGAAVRLRWP